MQLTKEDKDYVRHEDAVENFLVDDSSSDENSDSNVLAGGSLHLYGYIGTYSWCLMSASNITHQLKQLLIEWRLPLFAVVFRMHGFICIINHYYY